MPVTVKTNGGQTPPHLNADTPYAQVAVNQVIELCGAKPDIEAIIETAADVVVTSREVIDLPPGVKVVVKGKVMQRIHYMSAGDCQSVHIAEASERFCGFIVIEPWMPAAGLLSGVDAYIETVSLSRIGPRTIQACYVILLVPRCEEHKAGRRPIRHGENMPPFEPAGGDPPPSQCVITRSRTFTIGG